MEQHKLNVWVFFQDGGTPENGWGDRHYNLAQYYDSNISVDIFAASNSHLYKRPKVLRGLFQTEIINEGLKYRWVRIWKYSKSTDIKRVFSWFYFSIVCFFWGLVRRKKPDIIIVSSMPMFPIYSALLLRYFFGTKVVFEVRDIWPLSLLSLSEVKESNPFVRLLSFTEKMAYSSSDYIVSVLKNCDKHIKDVLGVNHHFNFTSIPNGISTSIQSIDHDFLNAFTKEHTLLNGKFVIGYFGTLGKANAMDYLFKASQILQNSEPDILFLIVGAGPDAVEFKKTYGSQTNILFIDKVEKSLVHSLISLVDITYLSWREKSIYEFGISPNKLNDYMMAKKPILMSYTGISTVIEESGCGKVVSAESVDAIIQGIDELRRSDSLPELGLNGREYVINNSTYSTLSKQYSNVFKEL